MNILKYFSLSLILLLTFLSSNAQKIFTSLDSVSKIPVFEAFIGGKLIASAWNAGYGFDLDYIDELDKTNEWLPVYGKMKINSPWLSCFVDYSRVIIPQEALSLTTNDVYGPTSNSPNYELNIGATVYFFKIKKVKPEFVKLSGKYVNSRTNLIRGFNYKIPHYYWFGIDGGYYKRKYPMVYMEEDLGKFYNKKIYWDNYGISGFFIGFSVHDIVSYNMDIFTDDLKAYSISRYRFHDYGIKLIFIEPLADNPSNYNYFEYSQFGFNIWAASYNIKVDLGLLPGRIKDWYLSLSYTIPIGLGYIINANKQ